MLGTAALSQSVPGEASEYLKGMQFDDGGWEWNIGFHSDTNTTSLAIQALIASGESLTSTVVTDGLAYLKAAQNADGGFPYRYDSTNPSEKVSDANSTAYAIQAIRAAGQDPNSDEWIISGLSPLNFLASLQLPDNSFEWQKDSGSNIKATMQVIQALMGDIFPLRRDVLPACPSRFLAWIGVNTP